MAFWKRVSNYMKTINNETANKKIASPLAHEPKTQLEHYLAYYVGRSEPGYAVLVTGEWGTGKTYQVTKALPESHAYYVSLFGLSTPQEIEAAVFAKMFPVRAWTKRASESLSSVSAEFSGVGTFGVDKLPAALATIFIRNNVDNTKPIIFDDLERCSLFKKEEDSGSKELLGIFNRYVEHHKCRVIVIAHDEKIVTDIKEAKEKIFGQTIKIEPDVDAAFQHFNKTLVESGREDFLGELKSEVLHIFKESDEKSLRILRHVLEDAQRLMSCVEARHKGNQPAMIEMVRLFSALAIECRSGKLSAEDLNDRTFSAYRYYQQSNGGNAQSPKTAFEIAKQKYDTVNITSDILDNKTLVSTLIEGSFFSSEICNSLDASARFILPETRPPWKILTHFERLDDDVVLPAIRLMNEQFDKREIIKSGEILHIVALKMMLAESEYSQETIQEIAIAAKEYIDDLLQQGRLPPRGTDRGWKYDLKRSYGGYGYWVSPNYEEQFNEVFNHLVGAREKALHLRYPDLIPPLLEALRTNSSKFIEMVCDTSNGTAKYEDVPILAAIPPQDFVKAWLASTQNGWYRIGKALVERKKNARLYGTLKPEADWVVKVCSEILQQAENRGGLTKLRIARIVEAIGTE